MHGRRRLHPGGRCLKDQIWSFFSLVADLSDVVCSYATVLETNNFSEKYAYHQKLSLGCRRMDRFLVLSAKIDVPIGFGLLALAGAKIVELPMII